ncbi:MAG: hypothetical protein AVDCRST_MAG38-1725 [uncultured Solirubrobacteraceae bacterium]|uniref:Glycosyl transferase family 1 domain-containing protein n=1 Tax=uncultured Solirubrobacteraceae bacterium TaxID=1162706 RepID=A0A6J4RT72_9ACTN|nr:MAG: hypothetical protein AVDCRST_MAG38-1725 [uncultured Solirubrobacteraceae bacterium]
MALERADVLLVSLGSTGGLRAADDDLAGALRRAGAAVAVVRAGRPREVRTFALTDLAWARAAREATRHALARTDPRAVLYSTTTAAALAPVPGAIRFDAPASGNRPGRHGVWQRPLERRRLREASLLVPWSEGALRECPEAHAPAVVVPVPISASAGRQPPRDITAITYGANPRKKGLDLVLAAWTTARAPGERLLVAGLDADQAAQQLGPAAAATPGVSFAGRVAGPEFRGLLRRSRVFITGVRREDYGIAQLEALSDGCLLVTAAGAGPYAALPIAERLDARLVGDDLAGALRSALDDPRPGYADEAAEALEPWRPGAVDRRVAEDLLPRLVTA